MYTRQRRANGCATTQNDRRDVDAVAESNGPPLLCLHSSRESKSISPAKKEGKSTYTRQKAVFNGVMNVGR